MLDINIKKYFDYKENDAIINLMVAVQYIFSHSKDEALLDEILNLSDIDMEAPLFLKHLDTQLERFKKKTNGKMYFTNINKSPTKLQGSVLTWGYYALYWAYQLDREEQQFIYPHSLSRTVLLFHKYYLTYKAEELKKVEKKSEHQGKSFFEDIAQGLTRAIEYMAAMVREKNDYLNKVYFMPHKIDDDLFKHFLNVVSSDSVEKNYFFIQKDESKDENYLLYENISEGIRFKIRTSRRIHSGKTEASKRNQKIVTYFAKDLVSYNKLIEIKFKGTKSNHQGGSRKKYDLQYTVREDFEEELYIPDEIAIEIMSPEEEQERLQKQKKRYRALPDVDDEGELDEKYVQNSDKQRRINRAFSANVTKRSLKLIADYDIPPREHLKSFIRSLDIPVIEKDFEKEMLFFTLFLFSCVTGVEYKQMIDALWEKDKVMTIDLNEGVITVELDETLFAKEKKNPLFIKAAKSISYKVPPLMIMLLKKVKNIMENTLSDSESSINYEALVSPEMIKRYESYITQRVENFHKKIVIKPNQMWRIVESYKKESLKEEMSTLFCVGKYQINDRAKMAYTSVHSKGQIHAEFIVFLYKELGLHEIIAEALNIDALLYQPKGQIDKIYTYAGSSVLIEVEQSRRFFREMQEMIMYEENEVIRFNLSSIYLRYALSLLIGTRTFLYSASLDNISFSLHILSISEKASTNLSGIRVIPLCKRAEQLIRSYQYQCKVMDISSEQIYIIDNGKRELYKKDLALKVLAQAQASQWLSMFIDSVPTNIGRHIITNEARECNFNGYYLEAFLGHYGCGEEQLGVFSTMDMQDYIAQCQNLTEKIADKYGILAL